MSELYACLYAREFPVQALLRLRPELRDKPCVVMEGEPPMQEVCSCNERAGGLGLAHGMTQVEVEAFCGIVALTRSETEEGATRAALLECAGGFSPRVEDLSDDRVCVCAIDIAGTQALFGPPQALARKLLDRIAALDIVASVAVNANFDAGIALARGSPAGSVNVVAAGEEGEALAPFPLDVLDLTEAQAETFSLWGIRTLGMLAALPETELIARMGQAGKRLRQLARGRAEHLFRPVEPPFTPIEHMELDYPVEVLDALLFAMNLMLEQIILRAAARVLALASVRVTLKLEGGAAHTRTVRPALPSSDRQLWLKLLHLDLEAHPPQAAILAVTLEAEPGSTSKVQLGLFAPQLPEPSRLDVTLARMQAVVGEGNVGRAVLKDTKQPDGFRMEPFRVPEHEPAKALAVVPRPAMRRLRPAEAVLVTREDERPRTFFFRERRYAVERAYGPWRMSGEWWNSTLWGCEQWDLVARSPDGAMLCCCMTRDLLWDEWQMAGMYD